MARRPVSGIVRDGEGNIVASATVTVTVYSSGLAATCYAAQSGGSALSGGVTTSGTDGAWQVWIDDGDHGVLTVFNVASSKSNYTTITTPIAA